MAPWQAFAEAFPPQSEWIPYARTESSDIYATFWAGMLTTVDNEWYGIRSGQRVRVLILNQQSQVCTSHSPFAAAGSSAEHMLLIRAAGANDHG